MVMTVSELAKRWNCSRKHVYKMRNDGKLQMFCIGESKGWRITDAEIEKFERAYMNKTQADLEPAGDDERPNVGRLARIGSQ